MVENISRDKKTGKHLLYGIMIGMSILAYDMVTSGSSKKEPVRLEESSMMKSHVNKILSHELTDYLEGEGVRDNYNSDLVLKTIIDYNKTRGDVKIFQRVLDDTVQMPLDRYRVSDVVSFQSDSTLYLLDINRNGKLDYNR